MRILIANANRQVVGGAETYLRALIPALRDAGHEIALLYEREPRAGAVTVDGDAEGIPRWRAHGAPDPAVAAATAWQPGVAYAHGLASPPLERALLERVPAVLFAHGYYGTCATGTKRHGWPTPIACRRRIGAGCLALHYPRRCGGLNPVAALESFGRQWERFRALPRYRAVCVASRHMQTEYLRHGLAAERVPVLPLPPTGISPDAEPGPGGGGSGVVLYVGRVTDLKFGTHVVDAIARAAHRLKRALTVTAVGDGPARPSVERLARRLGVPVTFRPWVEPEERNRLFRSAEILIVPSTWPEPWGLVGLEAACAALPAVAFASGGIPEWLAPGVTGELAPADPPTAQGLAHALVTALGDATHYAALRRGALSRAREFTMARHLKALVPVLERAAP